MSCLSSFTCLPYHSSAFASEGPFNEILFCIYFSCSNGSLSVLESLGSSLDIDLVVNTTLLCYWLAFSNLGVWAYTRFYFSSVSRVLLWTTLVSSAGFLTESFSFEASFDSSLDPLAHSEA